ncbi:hypothetical protein H3146_11110 [Streptomyces sp. OF3]|uniref:Uncharacterized protein n=1 Tax=Streptomyces alkaliterrae TaxID=2213162 RepID=A0A5P0YQG5_9ACTN|nr:hypothetical protein [Streptomyces alkaliterrae]MBB1253908.1 hypothetical protein [Streptomyces alkaliterrae]MBB1260478.1 hypothetical protein [Streptomyces alkaliterrae]MQS01682.1 hypothetical protein [Streptomyces alkaliterrae]
MTAPQPQPSPQASSEADAERTQLIPPQADFGTAPSPGGLDADATQYLPPQPSADADATQLIPPMGAAGPEGLEATQYLPPIGDEPYVPGGSAAPGASSATAGPATAERRTPEEFEGLFRPTGAARPRSRAPEGSISLFEQASAKQTAGRPPTGGGTRAERRAADAAGSRRKPILLGAAGAAVLITGGLVAGAALGGGNGGGESAQPQGAASSAPPVEEPTEPEPTPEPEESKDPAEEQAKELDKLLADSNNSRDAVIRSVENIKKCQNLDKAASDLRDAARQRNSLVTRLEGLSVNELPNHARLTEQLTKAWKASAAADDHYAAWADRVARPRGCRGGQARSTNELARANRASGEATQAKQAAARLWNPTARQYGLTERQATQL